MLRLLCAITVTACFVVAYSQVLEKAVAPTCDYTELYKKEGWSIPGITGAKKKWRAVSPGKAEVYKTALELTGHMARIQSFSCSREHVGRLEIEDREVKIMDLSSFDVGGHIFAYNLIYGVDGIAAEWSDTFYDLDGSGRFTLRRSETSRLVPDLLPNWVKNGKEGKTVQNGSPVISRK